MKMPHFLHIQRCSSLVGKSQAPRKLRQNEPAFLSNCPESELLTKVKAESEKVGLKLNIRKTKIMASDPITSWEIDGETVETVSDFIFWAPKSLQMVTATMKLKDTYTLEEKL